MAEGFAKPGAGCMSETAAAAAPKLKQARMLPYKTCRNQPKTTLPEAQTLNMRKPRAGWLQTPFPQCQNETGLPPERSQRPDPASFFPGGGMSMLLPWPPPPLYFDFEASKSGAARCPDVYFPTEIKTMTNPGDRNATP
jgi:hypothetical protein